MLENVRKQDYPESYGRGNSLFVFPYDDKKEERAFQWANTFASTPVSYCIVNLLILEVDNVSGVILGIMMIYVSYLGTLKLE